MPTNLGWRAQGDQFVHGGKGLFGGAHRMGAGGVEHAVMRLGNGADLGFVAQPGADRHHARDAGGAGAGQNLRHFAVEIGEIEVAVAVDKVGGDFRPSLPLCEHARRLVDLQDHIHEKCGRVKIDRPAAPRPVAKGLRQIGPDAGVAWRWATGAAIRAASPRAASGGSCCRVPARARRARNRSIRVTIRSNCASAPFLAPASARASAMWRSSRGRVDKRRISAA